MPCDTRPRRRRNPRTKVRDGELLTRKEIVAEAEQVVQKVQADLLTGKVKFKVGPQGAVAFEGITEDVRDGFSDVCIYRRIMASPTVSALVRAKIQQAELLAGRPVNKQIITAGVHSHDGGRTWHEGH